MSTKRAGRAAFLVLMSLLTVAGAFASAGHARASAPEQKTYIEFIIDASGSMRDKVDQKKSRMDVAKEVMKELVENLEDRPDLEIALRVYGFQLPGKSSCEDSGLMQSFGRVGQVRSSILKIVDSLVPRGMTPISYSLQEAAKDFPAGKGGRNVVVLVTDGEESCGADPCKVARKLEEDGLILKPYIVGFALTAAAEAKVRCIGNYFSATDRESLVTALRSIMQEVVSPPSLEIQAWGAGANVTARTAIEILDATGKAVPFARKGGESVLQLTLDEGTYTVRGTLVIEGHPIVATQSGVVLKKGETTRVRLDFGALAGKVTVVARAGSKDVSDRVQISVDRAGSPVVAAWAGVPPTASLAAGTYGFTVALRDQPSLKQQVKSWIPPDETTTLEVDLGELPAGLALVAQAGGKPISPSRLKAIAYVGAKAVREFGADQDRLVAVVAPGVYNVRCTYASDPEQTQTIENVQVAAGETREISAAFEVPGRVRVKVLVNGAPSDKAEVRLYRDGDLVRSVARVEAERGVFEAGALPGTYDILAIPSIAGYSEKRVSGVQVKAGQMVEREIAFTATMIRVKLMSEGKPYAVPGTRLMLYAHDPGARDVKSEEYICDLEMVSKGVFEAKVKEGTYDVLAVRLGEGFRDQVLRELEIVGGQTLERTIELGGSGILRVKLSSGGKPYAVEDTRLMVYAHDPEAPDVDSQEFVCDLEMVSKGVFEAKVREGTYDVAAVGLGEGFPDQVLRELEVVGGQTLEESLALPGIGTLRLVVTMDGEPCTEEEVRLMICYAETGEYVCDPEMTKEGVFEARLAEGLYDLTISDGFNEQLVGGLAVEAGRTVEREIEVDFGGEEEW